MKVANAVLKAMKAPVERASSSPGCADDIRNVMVANMPREAMTGKARLKVWLTFCTWPTAKAIRFCSENFSAHTRKAWFSAAPTRSLRHPADELEDEAGDAPLDRALLALVAELEVVAGGGHADQDERDDEGGGGELRARLQHHEDVAERGEGRRGSRPPRRWPRRPRMALMPAARSARSPAP